MALSLQIRHAGQTHAIMVDPASKGLALKQAIFETTGVPPERMKVMTTAGILKDDTQLSHLKLKEGQSLTVIGTAGQLPSVPIKQTNFLEDMEPGHANLTTGDPAGLVNLGQTCYLNSCLQVLRVMPQLQTALSSFTPTPQSAESGLTRSLKELFVGMSNAAGPVAPFVLLSSLRALSPQFAEQDNHGNFAQQDADEAWTQLLSALRGSLSATQQSTFVEQFMRIAFDKSLVCTENPEEAQTSTVEEALKLECNISVNTNFLLSGILDNLDQSVEKISPSLGRSAVYQQKTRLSRLPTYLTVRFYWRRDIQKKAKIMRKVKFPLQLDALDLVSDGLRSKIQPVNTAARQVLKDRDDRAKLRERARSGGGSDTTQSEEVKRREEQTSLDDLAKEHSLAEPGSNPTAIYELCAMITHKGATADSGHYIGWTRKEGSLAPSGEEDWHKFDDDKVTTVKADKILGMDGGGEDSVAYLLLYRAAI